MLKQAVHLITTVLYQRIQIDQIEDSARDYQIDTNRRSEFHPRTGHEGPEGGRVITLLFL
jgi:hypothetical protein